MFCVFVQRPYDGAVLAECNARSRLETLRVKSRMKFAD